MNNVTIANGIYRHYKNHNLYEVIGIVYNADNNLDSPTTYVLYKSLYKDKDFGKNCLWIRPLEQFLEEIDCNGKKVCRFVLKKKNNPFFIYLKNILKQLLRSTFGGM